MGEDDILTPPGNEHLWPEGVAAHYKDRKNWEKYAGQGRPGIFCKVCGVRFFNSGADKHLRQAPEHMDRCEEIPGKGVHGHMEAREIKAIFPREWDEYFKFCVIRNPFEKVISLYWFTVAWNNGELKPKEHVPAFDATWVWGKSGVARSWELYTIDGVPVLNFFVRQERLAGELGAVCRKLGIPFDGWLPRAHGNYRRDRRPPKEVLTPEQVQIIKDNFREEIEFHGYKLDPNDRFS